MVVFYWKAFQSVTLTDPRAHVHPCSAGVMRGMWLGRKAGRDRRGMLFCQGSKRAEPRVCHKEKVDFYLKHTRHIAGKARLRILKGENLSSN